MNILSQKETNCICGGNKLGDFIKKPKKEAQKFLNATITKTNKKILAVGETILNKTKNNIVGEIKK